MSKIPASDKPKGSPLPEPTGVAKPNAGPPAAVPDHAFEESIAGEEDPGASLDNNANGVPPPDRSSGPSTPHRTTSRPGSPN